MDIDVLKLLQATPHIEFLELVKFGVQLTNAITLELPRLTRLVMNNVYIQLFLRVTFPSPKNLTIHPVEHRDQSLQIIWGRLQVPPALTALKIEYLPLRLRDNFYYWIGQDK